MKNFKIFKIKCKEISLIHKIAIIILNKTQYTKSTNHKAKEMKPPGRYP